VQGGAFPGYSSGREELLKDYDEGEIDAAWAQLRAFKEVHVVTIQLV